MLWMLWLACVGVSHADDFLKTIDDIEQVGPTLDPDAVFSGYGGVGGRWWAHIATDPVLVGWNFRGERAVLAWTGFLELQNFSTYAPISFQMFRANTGLESVWPMALPSTGGRLVFRLGWAHESDHVADTEHFVDDFGLRVPVDGSTPCAQVVTDPYGGAVCEDGAVAWDNNNLSAYEYARLRVHLRQPVGTALRVDVSADSRVYTPAINPWQGRNRTYTLAAEGRVRWSFSPKWSLAVGARAERSGHRFDAESQGLPRDWNHGPEHWRAAEIAGERTGARGDALVVAAQVVGGNGRGSDFFHVYPAAFGGCLRFVR